MRPTPLTALCLTALLSPLLAACGEGDPDPQNTSAPTQEAPSTPTGTPTDTDSDGTASPAPETPSAPGSDTAGACPDSFVQGRQGDTVQADRDDLSPDAETWLCRYQVDDEDSSDERARWVRVSEPVRLRGTGQSVAATLLQGLRATDPTRACTADFGPVMLLSQNLRDGETVHLVLEEFGCRDAVVASNLSVDTLAWSEERWQTMPGTVDKLGDLLLDDR